MWKLWLGAIIVGIGLIVYGVQEMSLKGAAKADAQSLTCKELATNGPGDNVHVNLTDFFLYDDAAIIVQKGKRWKHVWLPAVPIDGAWAKQVMSQVAQGKAAKDIQPPREHIVLVKVGDVPNEEALDRFLEAREVKGMVVNSIDTIDSRERREIEEEMPGVDLRSAYIIEAGRGPAGMGKIAGFIGGGVALCCLPIVVMLRRKKG